ncbi:MAG TPA: hypothetical protein PK637_04990 [Flavobacteriales bacterium]|nr:hypothetical protein [Flavobacteriales bacterium]HRE75405.1 hypothetical protein [Flavobacteriales bacterium]HRE96098.1 hypothetical protein [Flavobacteriales bacterium]HRJ35669.1 hypothetical protein [Flavobacteriales bacterium]HRJ37434.1 hypothetical protein [Flavobacteriales bacterium]
MKRVLFFSAVVLLLCSSFSWFQSRDAVVESKSGLGVFIMCEPVQAYDKLFVVKTAHKSSKYVGGLPVGVVLGIDDPIDRLVQRALRKGRKKNIDAIITSDARMAVAIKFRGAPTVDERLRARPVSISGVDVYVKSKPQSSYLEVATISLKTENRLTVPGIDTDRLAKMIQTLIEQGKKAGYTFQGLITSDGVSATLISYK